MLVRIVRMTFDPDKVDLFLAIFDEVHPIISTFEGCREVKLYRDSQLKNVFYTHSIWDNEAQLDAYRGSSFFKSTWSKTKKLFSEKPHAYSLIDLIDQ